MLPNWRRNWPRPLPVRKRAERPESERSARRERAEKKRREQHVRCVSEEGKRQRRRTESEP